MRRSTLIVVIRCVSALALLWLLDSLSMESLMIPVAFLLPNCVCCPGPCTFCTGTPAGSVQAVIAGVADSVCLSCSSFNGTFVLTGSDGGTCPYSVELGHVCSPSSIGATVTYNHQSGKVVGGFSELAFTPCNTSNGFELSLTPPYVCNTDRSLTAVGSGLACCTHSGATFDAYML